jgi:UDP-GlcNAc3NAcA epimerase
MIKILTVVGARPQFIKASALSRALRNDTFKEKIEEIMVHTGQHYDANMSEVFFQELEIPEPKYNLNVGSDMHGAQTSAMIQKLETILQEEKPDALIIYGDTNSTLAAAIAAAKIHIPVVHIEAGLRSFKKAMPEEINRIVSDHVSTLLFTPTKKGMENLQSEGFNLNSPKPYTIDHPGVFHCGDIMFDNSLHFAGIAEKKSSILHDLKLEKDSFLLVTIHRDSNTDNSENLSSIMGALNQISQEQKLKIVLPVHPRTQKKWNEIVDNGLKQAVLENQNILMIPAVSFLDIICLEKNAALVITDSGGVQKESYFFKKKCLILRNETEWTELVDMGTAQLCGADKQKILQGFNVLISKNDFVYPPVYGDGKAAEFILQKIVENFS